MERYHALLLAFVHTYLLTPSLYVPVSGSKEDVASAQAVHVDDGVGGELHLLLEAKAPRRLGSQSLLSCWPVIVLTYYSPTCWLTFTYSPPYLNEDTLAGRRAEGRLARDDLVALELGLGSGLGSGPGLGVRFGVGLYGAG